MTRFARAKGSKSSNEKLPEESTSWHVMKQQLQQKYNESSNAENVMEEEWKQSDFENDAWNSGSTTWADIENSEDVVSKTFTDKKLKKRKNKFQMSDSDLKIPKKQSIKKHNDLITPISGKIKDSRDNAKNLEVDQDEHKKPFISKRKSKHQRSKDVEHTDTSGITRKKKNREKSVEIDTTINATGEPVVAMKKKRKTQGHSDENGAKKKKNDFAFETEKFSDAELPEDCTQEVNHGDPYINKKEKKKRKNKNNSLKVGKTLKAKQNESEDSTLHNKQYNRNNNSSDIVNKCKSNDGQRQNAPFKRRKPDEQVQIFYLNGRSIEIVKYDGFPVKKEDAENLKVLKQSLIAKGIPRGEIKVTMKLERRKAEKALAREKKKSCFHCRMSGHVLSECPELEYKQSHDSTTAGICFKCGSTEHTHSECRVVKGQDFRFAKCFVCNEQGHISRQCPDNPKGLYPKGGACRECGNVTHLKKDCPTLLKTKEETAIRLQTLDSKSLEKLDEEIQTSTSNENKSKKNKKVIKF